MGADSRSDFLMGSKSASASCGRVLMGVVAHPPGDLGSVASKDESAAMTTQEGCALGVKQGRVLFCECLHVTILLNALFQLRRVTA